MSVPIFNQPANKIAIFPFGILHEKNNKPVLKIHPQNNYQVKNDELFWLDIIGTAPTLELLLNHCKDLGYSETQVYEKLEQLHAKKFIFYITIQGEYTLVLPELENFYIHLTEPIIATPGRDVFNDWQTTNIVSLTTNTTYNVLDFTRHIVEDYQPTLKLGHKIYLAMTELKDNNPVKLDALIQSEHWETFWETIIKDLQQLVRNKNIYFGIRNRITISKT